MMNVWKGWVMMKDFFLWFIILLMAGGVVLQLVVGGLYAKLIRETEDAEESAYKLVKACKLKFTASYQINGGMPNITVFVDRYLGRMKLGRFRIRSVVRFSKQLMLLAALAAGAGIYLDIRDGKHFMALLPYYIVTFIGLYAFFFISELVDLPAKKHMLKMNLVDYLENVLEPKLIRRMQEEENRSAATMRRREYAADRSRRNVGQYVSADSKNVSAAGDTRELDIPDIRRKKEYGAKELGEALMEYLT